MVPRSIYPALSLCFLAFSGCQASVKVDAETPSTPKDDSPMAQAPEPPPSIDNSPAKVQTSFLGVTHALSLSAEAAKIPTCHCLAVAVGLPSNPAFTWQGTPPTVGDDALVIGISGDGTPCDWGGKQRGPSISGVETDGPDIVVSIEEGRTGIPLAHGALFPKPQGDIVFRASRGLPYDDPLANGNMGNACRIKLH